MVYRASQPHIAVLGRLPQTTVWRNVERFPDALVIKGLLVVRIDADFFFANIRFIHSAIISLIEKEKNPVYVLLLDLSAVTDIDFSAVTELKKTMKWLRANNVTLFATAVNGIVRDMLKKSGFIRLLGEENVFWLHNDAVYAAKEVIRGKLNELQDQDDDFLVEMRGSRSSFFGGEQRAFAYRERPVDETSFWNSII